MQQDDQAPLEAAREKTARVQKDLELATAELELVNGALQRHLPPERQVGDVGWALAQNEEMERKVQQAAEELEEVEELLEQAGRD